MNKCSYYNEFTSKKPLEQRFCKGCHKIFMAPRPLLRNLLYKIIRMYSLQRSSNRNDVIASKTFQRSHCKQSHCSEALAMKALQRETIATKPFQTKPPQGNSSNEVFAAKPLQQRNYKEIITAKPM